MGLRGIPCGDMDVTDLIQDRALVNTVMNLRVVVVQQLAASQEGLSSMVLVS
jgi:hypothetical protein